MTTAFVLGGGGLLGAHEVGMLRALAQAGIRPDLVIGTSIGALNGAFVAADPDGAAARLGQLWNGEVMREAFRETLWSRAVRLARSGTHLHAIEPLQQRLTQTLPATDFAGLKLPLHCVAASIEKASAVWFSSGPLVPAVLASCAVPGLLPPVEIDGEHYFDGGLVDSIPVGRAVALGATTVYVLQVGRIETPLAAPRRPWEVGLVAFEIARRHRFHEEMSALPEGITVHVLPTGGKRPVPARRAGGIRAGAIRAGAIRAGAIRADGDRRAPDLSQLRYRDKTMVQESIERAYEASTGYLAAVQNV